MELYSGKASPAVLDYLLKRRSAPVDRLSSPGPVAAQLRLILQAAARVPDHGRAVPWHFVIFAGAAREEAGQFIAESYKAVNPDATQENIEREATRFMHAPIVIGVIARARKGKHPLWEQILSAGAACMNLSLAANASGFGAAWLTQWYAYNDQFKKAIGLDARDHIAGFIHIGTLQGAVEERDRPDLDAITTFWSPGETLNKGDVYDNEKFDYPRAGFDFSPLVIPDK